MNKLEALIALIASKFRLGFTPELEREFRTDYNKGMNAYFSNLLIGVMIGTLCISLTQWSLLDGTITRLLILYLIPPLFVGWLLLKLPADQSQSQIVIPFSCFLLMLGLAPAILSLADKTEGHLKLTFLTIFMFLIYGGLRLLVIPAIITGIMVSVGLTMISLIISYRYNTRIPAYELFYITVGCNLFGIPIAHSLETMRRSTFLARKNLENERGTTKDILSQILPDQIIKNMAEKGNGPIVQSHDNCGIIFLKFDFLDADQTQSALVNFYKILDRIVVKYNMEKIKHTGSTYLLIDGLGDKAMSAEQCLCFAFAVRQEILMFSLFKKFEVNFRIGIHSGRLASGIIGQNMLAYDVWGESVNLASRISEKCPPNTIIISESIAETLPPAYQTRPIGSFDLKGFGHKTLYECDEIDVPRLLEKKRYVA